NRTNLVVIDAIYKGCNQNNLNACFVQVIYRTQFHIEEVANLPVAVRVVADPIKLEINVPQPCLGGFATELLTLRELDSVGGSLHRVITHLPRISNRLDKVRRDRWLTPGELNRHLPTRFDGNCVIQNLFDLIHTEFMDKPNLVGVHEAWVTHHVAPVGQINGQHCATAILNRARTMIVEFFIIVSLEIATWKHGFNVCEELRIDRHHILEVTVYR